LWRQSQRYVTVRVAFGWVIIAAAALVEQPREDFYGTCAHRIPNLLPPSPPPSLANSNNRCWAKSSRRTCQTSSLTWHPFSWSLLRATPGLLRTLWVAPALCLAAPCPLLQVGSVTIVVVWPVVAPVCLSPHPFDPNCAHCRTVGFLFMSPPLSLCVFGRALRCA
jgi:hypothetical protein